MVDATLAALAELPEDARHGGHLAFVTHSIPIAMNDSSGPRGAAYVAQHRLVAAEIVERVREETGHRYPSALVYCSRSGPPAGARGSSPTSTTTCGACTTRGCPAWWWSRSASSPTTWRSSTTSTPRRRRPPRSSGCRSRARPPPGVDPRFVAMVRNLLVERGAAERGEPPERAAVGSDAEPGTCARSAAAPTRAAVVPRCAARTEPCRNPTPSRTPTCSPSRWRRRARPDGWCVVDARGRGRRRRHQVQPDRRGHRGRPGVRGAGPRPAARRPPRRRLRGRGGRRRARDLRHPLDRRPHRRDGELPLRPAAVRRLDRRCARRRGGGRGGAQPRRSGWSTPPTRGAGATCNGVPLEVRPTPPLDQSLVATGFGYETAVRERQAARGRPDAAAGPRHPSSGLVRPRPLLGGGRPGGRLRRGRPARVGLRGGRTGRARGRAPPSRSGPRSLARTSWCVHRGPVGPISPLSYAPVATSATSPA